MKKRDIIVTEKSLERWESRYLCTLGRDSSWCDGIKARRCPMALVLSKKVEDGAACYLAM